MKGITYEVTLTGKGKNFYFNYYNIAKDLSYEVRIGESNSCTCQSFYSNCKTSKTCKHIENAKSLLKTSKESVLVGGVVQVVKPLKKSNFINEGETDV